MPVSNLTKTDSTIESEIYRRALERAVEETEREFAQRGHLEVDKDLRELPLQQPGLNHR
jgi:hypothetical protein